MLKYCSIGSGSSGNCHVVSYKDTGILIDAGLAGKRITSGIEQADFDIDKIYTTTSSRTKDTVKKLSELKSIEIIAKTKKRSTKIKDIEIRQINTEIGINPREAFYAKKELVDIKDSLNMICGESIMAYPPGIPIISPGEIITYEIINYINLLKDSGAYFTDAQDKKLNKILVVNDTASIS